MSDSDRLQKKTMAEPQRAELDPLFAAFGRACLQAQLLEDALRLLLLTGREYAKTQVSDEALRYPVNQEGIRTLGEVFKVVLTVETVNAGDREFISKAIRERNTPVHSYWLGDRRPRILTPEGRAAIVDDLRNRWHFLREATGKVHKMIDLYLAACGVTMQQFIDQGTDNYVSDLQLLEDEGLVQ